MRRYVTVPTAIRGETMCVSKAEGGYRCAKSGAELRNNAVDNFRSEIQDVIGEEAAASAAIRGSSGWTREHEEYLQYEVDHDGAVRATMSKQERADDRYEERFEKVAEILDRWRDGKIDDHTMLCEVNDEYADKYGSSAAENDPEILQNRGADQYRIISEATAKSSETGRYFDDCLMEGTQEGRRLVSARMDVNIARGRVESVRRRQMTEMMDPTFRSAVSDYIKTPAGRKSLANAAEAQLQARYSDKSRRDDLEMAAIEAEGTAYYPEAHNNLRRFDEGRSAIGTVNRASAYQERVSKGRMLGEGEEYRVSPKLAIVHPDDSRANKIGYVAEGTDDAALYFAAEYRKANSTLSELRKEEAQRIVGNSFGAATLRKVS